jgi:nicotinate-nucleotide adenylyltransferase
MSQTAPPARPPGEPAGTRRQTGDASGPERPERLGLLGGTFDPPHEGHLAAARACLGELGLDRVLLVVANDPWQKAPQRTITPAEDRYAMVTDAVEGAPRLEASRIEIDRGGPSYTVETVEALRAEAAAAGRPPPEVYLVVGADLVDGLGTWKRVEELRRLVTLAVVSRPRSIGPGDPTGWRVVHVDGEAVDVSSSELRDRLGRGCPVDGLIPESVIRCIRRRGLYAVCR